jgi:hypothetical protein
MTYSIAFEQASVTLFSRVRENRPAQRDAWEAEHGPIDDETAEYLFSGAIACVDHLRFIPCRTCLYQQPATEPYSCDEADLEAVRNAQHR